MIIRSNALALPLRDACVDLIVTSPPYFALRSYRDGDEHYAGQLGSEETPGAFVDALIEATREMVRVLKPTGSIFVNLGDKYAGSGGHNNSGIAKPQSFHEGSGRKLATPAARAAATVQAARRNAPDRYNQNSGGIPAKCPPARTWSCSPALNALVGMRGVMDSRWHRDRRPDCDTPRDHQSGATRSPRRSGLGDQPTYRVRHPQVRSPPLQPGLRHEADRWLTTRSASTWSTSRAR